MHNRKPFLHFAGSLAVIYLILLIPWPGLAPVYVSGVCALGNGMLGTFTADGRVTFETHPNKPWTCMQTLYARDSVNAGRREHDTRQDYLAAAVLIALTLATPVSRRRKALSLGIGLALIHVFLIFRIWLGLVDAFSDEQLGMIHLAPSLKYSLSLAVLMLSGSSEASYIVPFVIWILVTFRRSDWQRLGFPSAAPTPAAQ